MNESYSLLLRARLHFMWITSRVWISVWSDSKLDLFIIKSIFVMLSIGLKQFFINCFSNWVSVIRFFLLLQLLVVWKLIEHSLNLVISLKYKMLKKKEIKKINMWKWMDFAKLDQSDYVMIYILYNENEKAKSNDDT